MVADDFVVDLFYCRLSCFLCSFTLLLELSSLYAVFETHTLLSIVFDVCIPTQKRWERGNFISRAKPTDYDLML